MKIVLLRHGRPEMDLNERQNEKISAFDIKRIVEDYRWVGLAEPQTIPPEVKLLASQCNICVTSDFARSIESAQLIVGDNIYKSDSIYREAEMPHPLWHWPKFSMKYWFYLLRCFWYFGYQQNGESVTEVKQNARIGAQQLVEFAEKHHSVLLVGHGINIHFLSKELRALGWFGANNCATNYWDYNQFVLE